MTVANQTNRTSAVGSGSTGQEVPFSFPIIATSDLSVTVRTTATGAEVDQAETTNYTVVISGDTGGTLTTVTAVETTEEIHLIRALPFTQSLDLEQGGDFSAENVEDALDKNAKLSIDNKDSLDRSLRLPDTDSTAFDMTIPNSVDRASKVLNFDSDGNVGVTTGATTFTVVNGVYDTLSSKFPLRDVKAYGAQGDGTTDDSTAFQAAITACGTGGSVFIPKTGSGYLIKSELAIANPMLIESNRATVFMDFDTDDTVNTKLFAITSDGVTVKGIIFDGSKTTGETHDQNRYVVRTDGSSGTHLKNVHVVDCEFNGLDAKKTATTKATHGVYYAFSDESSVRSCVFNDLSGAAVFINACEDTKVLDNFIQETQWYSIHYEENCVGYEIAHNWIGGTGSGIRDKGSSIDIMSQDVPTTDAPVQRGSIHDNYITGLCGGPTNVYPFAMRISSSAHVSIYGNVVDECTTEDGVTPFSMIFITSRPNAEEPSKNITVTGNVMVPGQKFGVGVLISVGDSVTSVTENIVISNNTFHSLSATKYMSSAVVALVAGSPSFGIRNLIISNNVANGIPGDAAQTPDGMVGLRGLTGAHIENVKIHGNHFTYLGTSSDTDEIGIYLDAFVDNTEIFDNTIDGFNANIRVDADNGDVRFRGNDLRNATSVDFFVTDVPVETLHNSKYDFVEFIGVDNTVVMVDNQMVTINGSI